MTSGVLPDHPPSTAAPKRRSLLEAMNGSTRRYLMSQPAPSPQPRSRHLHSACMPPPRRFSQVPYQGPPGSTELLLVRHAASADAIEGEDFELLDGHGNPPLSDIGRKQAALVGARLALEK